MTNVKRLITASLTLLSALLPLDAFAQTLTVDAGETITLSGDLLYESVTINGTLRVTALGPGTGFLRLRARDVSISTSGVVDASAAGYRGGQGTMGGGEGHNDNSGAGQTPPMIDPILSLPGGGGSHIGPGGPGLTLNCGGVAEAFGGIVYDDPQSPLGIMGLGSAGGSSHAGNPNPGITREGGNGGGAIIIEAETMDMAGQLLADGADGAVAQGAAPGGGAGGTIWLRLGALSLNGGVIRARGGNGALGNSSGGGGGGGLVVVESPLQDTSTLQAITDVSGGSSNCAAGSGQGGALLTTTLDGCLDLDGDGAAGFPCMDEDCDDLNAGAYPGANEICNDIDDDCDGERDEPEDGPYCSSGAAETCQAGECVSEMVDGGVPPDGAPKIEFGGGLCSASLPGERSPAPWLAAWLFAAAALGGMRRGRRSR